MDTQKQEIHIMPPAMVVKAATAALGVLALWGAAQFLISLKEYRFVGSGTTATNTITVSGEGEVFAVPDLATFSLTVREEAKEVKDAQKTATEKGNKIIAALKAAGVDEKDIKTTSYNVNPKYEWYEAVCTELRCPPGRQEMVGFEVWQTVEVKVRDTEKAGDILSQVGGLGVSDISGLSFTIDDEDALKTDAREQAIGDAEAKAKELAGQLGVELVRIVGFTEDAGGYMPYYKTARMEMAVAMDSSGAAAPELPVGENKIVSNVTITYEIR